MRHFMNIVIESHQCMVSADDICEYVADMNDRDDPYEGPVPNAILRFRKYMLVQLPLSKIDLHGFDYDPDLAQQYAELVTEAPPVVYDSISKTLIDGFHRAQAALITGAATIAAYVGIDPDPNWEG